MKVIQINAVNKYGSTGRATYEFDQFLKKCGIESYVLFSIGKKEENQYKIGNIIVLKFHALMSRLFGLQGYFSYFSTKKMLKYVSKINPDIIHLRNLHSNYINLNLLFSYIIKTQIATVITLDDCWYYTGKCTHYFLDNCYKWQEKCGNCPRIKKDIPSWFFDRTKKMLNDKKKWFSRMENLAVIGVSNWITNEAKKSILSSAQIITRIYNGIDRSVFKPADFTSIKEDLKLKEKFIILGVASVWSKGKGLYGFINLTEKLSDEYVILLVGKMPLDVVLPSRIISISETQDIYELAKYYTMADVFLNFSLEESFGKVVVEALACGTPVISIDSTANSELVGNNCGYIVNMENYEEEIIDKIKLIKQKSKNFYSKDCIEHSKKFEYRDRSDEHLRLYEELLKK